MKKDKMRFFDSSEEDLMEEVALTDEEWDFFDKLEYTLYKTSGKSYINGGYCLLRIYECEETPEGDGEPAESSLFFYDNYGTEGESWEQGEEHKYDRINKKCSY